MKDEDGDDRSGDDVDSDPDSDTPYERDVEPGDDDDNEITEGGPAVGEDEDDHDPAGIEIFDLALIKQNVTAGPHYYGQVLEFKFTIYNQGSITTTGLTVSDTIPCGYIFTPGGVNAGWSYNASTNEATYDYSGSIVPGGSDEISMFLELQQCNDSPADAWTNISEISDAKDDNGDPVDDFDGDFDDDPHDDPVENDEKDKIPPDDEDNHDPEKPVIFDLALRKTADDRGPYAPGEDAPFTICVYNQGNVEATNVVIYDYISPGYIYNDGDNLPAWTQNGGRVEYPAGSILPGDSVCIPLVLEIQISASPRLEDWDNYAEVGKQRCD